MLLHLYLRLAQWFNCFLNPNEEEQIQAVKSIKFGVAYKVYKVYN